jgi:hypothetical protein
MDDYEKLGVFYLGRQYDLAAGKPLDAILLYDSKDLVTHAVCVGMTGSGKTGLCISLIEEAAIDGVPSLLIDPKGDLTNLLLTFPQLRGEDFLPWVNAEDAAKKGLSVEAYAEKQAETWRNGLAEWGQSGERIQRLKDSAECVIYTPGSTAGVPISILRSFARPEAALLSDAELLRERISTTVTSLLGLIGIQADPIQSREHILLATILDTAWKQGQDLDLAALIQRVQEPPVTKIGVLDLESFYPAKDRFGLVMALNNLLASPGFHVWLEGQPLEIGQILYTPSGKPRIAIMSIAHLSDAERMFFVSLLLNQVLGWMRGQPGTTSLRALLYMDEIFGYLPPTANPPSKTPMLTLLKQARAFGLGIVLATQNPVDLDYKALSNAGTWWIGRLQTERDKARLLDGLEGAAAAGERFDRRTMEQILAGLGNRVFLMNNVHEDAPVAFQTRWALSYLRGPLTRDQIKALSANWQGAYAPAPPVGPVAATPESTQVTPSGALQTPPVIAAAAPATPTETRPPAVPPDVPVFYLPATAAGKLYRPTVIGIAKVRYLDKKNGLDETRDVVCAAPITDGPIPVDWDHARQLEISPADLAKNPPPDAQFAPLPAVASQARSYATWSRDFVGWVTREHGVTLWRSPSLGQVSKPDEDERDFRIRLSQLGRERRDEAVEALRRKYAPRRQTLENRLLRAQQALDREKAQATQQDVQTGLTVIGSLVGAFTGRKLLSATTVSRATSAARGVGRAAKERGDIARATETVEDVKQELAELDAQFQADAAALEGRIDPLTEPLEQVVVKPTRTNVSVQLVALGWSPTD